MEDLLANHDWLGDAACKGMPLAAFFPSTGLIAEETAAVCRACPVREECLRWSYQAGVHDAGYFGGVAPSVRRALSEDEAVERLYQAD
jgi:WhiB family redox-sensing transcriptional regulator